MKKKLTSTTEHKEHDERLREVCEEAIKFFESSMAEKKEVREYVRSRGLQEETVRTWRLGYAPASWEALSKHLVAHGFSKDDIVAAGFAVKSEKKPGEIFDRFRGRIIFPIFDSVGRPIAVSGRFFEKVPGQKEDGEPAKYVNSPETELFKKSKILYGFDRAKNTIRKADCILLVEGQFDLVLCHQSGLSFAVALSGTALTEEHLRLLSRLSKRLVLALDADSAGVRAGLKSAEMALRLGFDVKVPTFPDGKDPADIARENPELLKAAVRTSKTAVEFFLDALWPTARDERAYKKIVEVQVLPLIAAVGSKIEQEHFVRVVAQRLGVSEGAVLGEVLKHPSLGDQESEDSVATKDITQEIAQTPLERAIGMLLLRYPPHSPRHEQVLALVGAARAQEIERQFTHDTERLRFAFDTLGDDEELVAESLLHLIERHLIQEKISALQIRLRQTIQTEHSALLHELSNLKRREEELRQ